MVYCSVKNCRTYTGKLDEDTRFFRFPTPSKKKHQSKKQELTIERRAKWLEILSLTEANVANYKRICNKHFVSGAPAKLLNTKSIDWLPTLNIDIDTSNKKRTYKKRKPKNPEIISPNIEFVGIMEQNQLVKVEDSIKQEVETNNEELNELIEKKPIIISPNNKPPVIAPLQQSIQIENSSACSQDNDKNLKLINALNSKILSLQEELEKYKFGMNYFCDENEKVQRKKIEYFTGLPDSTALNTLYEIITLNESKIMSTDQIFVMALMKLRLNLPFEYLSFKYNISADNAFRCFCSAITQMYADVKQIITWLERIYIRESASDEFQTISRRRVTFIIDILEVAIEKPATEVARKECWSPVKKTFTLKCLIVYAPIGTVMMVSEMFGGNHSNKFILDKSEFIDLIEEGDVVLAQQNLLQSYSNFPPGSQDKVYALSKSNATLVPFNVTDMEEMAIVQKNVDHITNVPRQKYSILSNRINNSLTARTLEEKNKWIQQIATVCCALVNITIEQPDLDE